MVVVSQIWIQCLRCMQIIGHVHLRVGSEVEPELGGALYTALVVSLAQVEKMDQYTMSAVYGYNIRDNEGIGLFTVQKGYYRIFFLCEGIYGRGIPYLEGKKIHTKLQHLFNSLEELITEPSCELLHSSEDDPQSFWLNLIYSMNLGEAIPLEEFETIFPLQFVCITEKQIDSNTIQIEHLESVRLGSLGYGWSEIDQLLANKIQGIFNNPQYSFLIYKALFHQISEFVPEFTPNSIILAYQKGGLQESIALIAFLSLVEHQLIIHFCLPVAPGLAFEGSQSVQSYLRSILLDHQF